MADFYDDGRTRITANQLIHGNRTIPLDLISNQVKFKMPFELQAFLINSAGVLVALILFAQMSMGTFIVGLGILALCGWNVKNILTTETHILSIDLHNGDTFRLESGSGEVVDAISNALKEARVHR